MLDLVRDALSSDAARERGPVPARVRAASCSPTRTASSPRCRATSSGSWACSSSGCRPTGSEAVTVSTPRRRAPAPDAGAVDPGASPAGRGSSPPSTSCRACSTDVVLDLGLGPAGLRPDVRRPARASSTRCARRRAGERDICIYPRDPHVLVGPRARRAVHRPQLHLPARPAPLPAPRRSSSAASSCARSPREAEMERINEHLRAQRHGRRRRRRPCGATTARAPSPTWSPRTGAPGRSSARSPGSTTRSPSATPRAAPACGAWPSHAQDAPPGHRRGAGPGPRRALRRPRPRLPRPLGACTTTPGAIALYRKLGFTRVAAVCVKRKNPINTPLFAARPPGLERPEPLRADHRRGGAAPRDPRRGHRRRVRASCGCRSAGGRCSPSSRCRSSPPPWRMSRCDDKRVTRRIMERAGVRVARGVVAGEGDLADAARAAARGRRGGRQARPRRAGPRHHRRGHRRGRSGARGRRWRCSSAPTCWSRSWCAGDDLRVVVIDRQVVAAAVRRPAEVVGDGRQPGRRAGPRRPAAGGSGRPAGSRASRWTTPPPRWSPRPG